MSDPAYVKPVFDQAIANQMEPLRLFATFTASLDALARDFSAAMKQRNNGYDMVLYGEGASFDLHLTEFLEDEEWTLMKLGVTYHREQGEFQSEFNADPDGVIFRQTGHASSIEIETYPATEKGIQELSVYCARNILGACSENMRIAYQNYQDSKVGQMRLGF